MSNERISRRDLLRGGVLRRGLRGAINGLAGVLGIPDLRSVDAAGAETSRAVDGHSSLPVLGSEGTEGTPRRIPASGAIHGRIPVHRPPGAVNEAAFLAGCTRCGDCIRACPVSAIVPAPSRFREAAGTPMIDPVVAPCVMCDDAPCISACAPGVLRRDRPLVMARALIQKSSCLAWNGSFCSVCFERCPVPGAIVMDSGRPRIVEQSCTGCGVCAFVCPAPGSAVVVMPLEDRPCESGTESTI